MSEEENIESSLQDGKTERPQETNAEDTDTTASQGVNSESIVKEELTTSNLPPTTENMEVHKHPHHVTHKKKWGEYLLEFFMLFLAVFLGFVAENLRESSAEHEHAEEYAKELYREFYADSLSF